MDTSQQTMKIIRNHLNAYARTCDPKHEWESGEGAKLERVLLFTQKEWQTFWDNVEKDIQVRSK